MALVSNKNYAYLDLSEIADGDEVVGCNLSQAVPDTPLPRATYRDCNLLNCAPAAGSHVVNCLTAQKSLCYWQHVMYDDEGAVVANPCNLPVEDYEPYNETANPDGCKHVTEIIDIDGVNVYVREDTLLSTEPSTAGGWI